MRELFIRKLIKMVEQSDIDSRRTSHHRLDEPFVARHIHHAERRISDAQGSKPQLDGHAPPLLFRKPVRIRPGQGAYQ